MKVANCYSAPCLLIDAALNEIIVFAQWQVSFHNFWFAVWWLFVKASRLFSAAAKCTLVGSFLRNTSSVGQTLALCSHQLSFAVTFLYSCPSRTFIILKRAGLRKDVSNTCWQCHLALPVVVKAIIVMSLDISMVFNLLETVKHWLVMHNIDTLKDVARRFIWTILFIVNVVYFRGDGAVVVTGWRLSN